MSTTKKVITTYAKSLFQNLTQNSSAKKGRGNENFDLGKLILSDPNKEIPDVYLIGEELLLIRSLIISSKTINQFFQNPTYSEAQKLAIILSIFPGLTVSFQSFLKILTERSHLYLIPEISNEYNQMLIAFKNSTKVKILTASGLKENYGILLLNTLRTVTNSKEIILNAFYNPKLLGGLIIEYNSKSIDASVLKEFSLFFNEV
jgi:ATP synthase F1 delta subunit